MGPPRKPSSWGATGQLALSDRHVKNLQRLLRVMAGASNENGAAVSLREALEALARQIHSLRALRSSYLPAAIFGEPAWDILLALYGGLGDGRASLDLLCRSADAPLTTLLRWINFLEAEGLVSREGEPHGPLVHLTQAGSHAMESYLAQLCRSDE